MSKVVHLSDEAHNKAKAYCKEHSLKMSDWVAALIEEAIEEGRGSASSRTRTPPVIQAVSAPTPVVVQQPVQMTQPVPSSSHPPKKKLPQYHEDPRSGGGGGGGEEGSPPWSAPPFWNNKVK